MVTQAYKTIIAIATQMIAQIFQFWVKCRMLVSVYLSIMHFEQSLFTSKL